MRVTNLSKRIFLWVAIIKTCFGCEQASERGAKFLVRVDEEAGRCYLQGGAFLVMAGTLLGGSLQYSK